MNKKFWSLISLLLVAVMLPSACQSTATTQPVEAPAQEATEAPAAQAGGEVYFLNFKPEVAEVYQKIADAYKKETGNTLKVVTAAAGTYEQTLSQKLPSRMHLYCSKSTAR